MPAYDEVCELSSDYDALMQEIPPENFLVHLTPPPPSSSVRDSILSYRSSLVSCDLPLSYWLEGSRDSTEFQSYSPRIFPPFIPNYSNLTTTSNTKPVILQQPLPNSIPVKVVSPTVSKKTLIGKVGSQWSKSSSSGHFSAASSASESSKSEHNLSKIDYSSSSSSISSRSSTKSIKHSLKEGSSRCSNKIKTMKTNI